MRTQEQIDNIKKNFSDPYIVENFITENDVLYLINLFDNSTPNQPKVYKNTGPVTLDISNYLNDPIVNNIINRLKLAIGDFDITAGTYLRSGRNSSDVPTPNIYLVALTFSPISCHG